MTRSIQQPTSLPGKIAGESGIYLLFFLLVCVFTYPLILHPASLLRGLNDPYLFTWILNWAASHIITDPTGFFNANIFYPYGNTFAYSEPLLVPALLTAAPILKLTGNPILAHNLTLLFFQALCGWAACFATTRITGCRTAGWIAGITFANSPFRIGYYNYLNVHMQFAIPLALVSFSLFLEKHRVRYLAATMLLLWLQMITIFYGGVPMAMLLALFLACFLLLRPFGWQFRKWMHMLVWGFILLVLLAPLLLPYFNVFRELGLERSLKDVHRYSADWYSFFDTGKDHNFYQLADSGKYPGFFPGFTVYLLAALALLSLWRKEEEQTGILVWLQRLIGIVISILCGIIAFFLVRQRTTLSLYPGFSVSMQQATLGILLAGTLALALRGLALRGRSHPTMSLQHRDWIMLLGLFSLFFVLLTLGPIMYIKGHAAGTGIYAWLYDIFLPLHTIRLSIRLGYMPVLLLGILAGLGLVVLKKCLSPRLRPVLWLLPLLLLVEYSSFPLDYQPIDWNRTPPVYQWLSEQKGDFAILEWPCNNEEIDSRYVFWSLKHKKTKVTGVSGFFPPFTRQVVETMLQFPDQKAITRLRRIYPLKYLLVHGDHFFKIPHRKMALSWAARTPAGMTLVRRFANTTVFGFREEPETETEWERTFSSALVKNSPVAVFRLTSDGNETFEVTALFNGRAMQRITAGSKPIEYRIPLPGPYPAADRNTFRLQALPAGKKITITKFRLETW